jgi:hypothetical protein
MVDWAELDFIVTILVGVLFSPFTYLAWASGYFDLMTEQARRNGWVAPSMARRLGRAPPTPSSEWEREFGRSTATAYSPPKVKNG